MSHQNLIGVDFSGGARAGEKIWVCQGRLTPVGVKLESLSRGQDLPGGGPALEEALPALVRWIAGQSPAWCGLDFPLALARGAFTVGTWRQWVMDTVAHTPGPEQFKALYPEAKRETDRDARAPFAPLNLRMYRQTFHGLRGLVLPLLQDHQGSAVPLENTADSGLNLVEVCPASWLKREDLYLSYKGKSPQQAANRAIIWAQLQERCPLLDGPLFEDEVMQDTEGDALDAVLALAILSCNWPLLQAQQPRSELEMIEGRIYF